MLTGAALHHLVEKPFRYGQRVRPAYATALGVCLALGVSAPLIVHPWRTAQANVERWRAAIDVPFETWQAERQESRCEYATPCGAAVRGRLNIYVIGDSHSFDGVNIFRAVFNDAHIVRVSAPDCDPLIGAGSAVYRATAEQRLGCDQLIAELYGGNSNLAHADVIVISSLIHAWFDTALDRSLAALSRLHKPIIVIGNSPAYTKPLRDIVRVRRLTPLDAVPSQFKDPWFGDDFEGRLRAVAERHGASYLSLRDFFCPNGRCTAWTPDRTRLNSYDEHHLTLAAAQAFGHARMNVIGAAVHTHEGF